MAEGDAKARQADALSASIAPLLAGQDPGVQAAALADLAAIWLAGHVVPGDRAATAAMRHELLEDHLVAILALVEHYDRRPLFGARGRRR